MRYVYLILFAVFMLSGCTDTETTPAGRIGKVIDLSSDLPKTLSSSAKATSYSAKINMNNIDVHVTVKWDCVQDSTGKYIKSVEFINDKESTGYSITASLAPEPINKGKDTYVLMAKVGSVKANRISTFRFIERNVPFEIRADGRLIELN